MGETETALSGKKHNLFLTQSLYFSMFIFTLELDDQNLYRAPTVPVTPQTLLSKAPTQ